MTASTSQGPIHGAAVYSETPVFRLEADEVHMIRTTKPMPLIAGDRALMIAQADAQKAYRDLSEYRIQVVLETDGWHIDYELKDPSLKGGGPHYIIDAFTGAIVSKRYEQ
jgi:hypothetical protein